MEVEIQALISSRTASMAATTCHVIIPFGTVTAEHTHHHVVKKRKRIVAITIRNIIRSSVAVTVYDLQFTMMRDSMNAAAVFVQTRGRVDGNNIRKEKSAYKFHRDVHVSMNVLLWYYLWFEMITFFKL